jgi:hypothetical protein
VRKRKGGVVVEGRRSKWCGGRYQLNGYQQVLTNINKYKLTNLIVAAARLEAPYVGRGLSQEKRMGGSITLGLAFDLG